jgi:hypothetical protein
VEERRAALCVNPVLLPALEFRAVFVEALAFASSAAGQLNLFDSRDKQKLSVSREWNTESCGLCFMPLDAVSRIEIHFPPLGTHLI